MATRVPDGYDTVTPWIVTRDTAGLLAFLGAAFGAEELGRVPGPGGTIAHAEARIGDSVVMAFDAEADWPATPALLRLYVEDADATYAQAIEAGARPVTTLATSFFGDRGARLADPFGNIWWLQSHVEDVDPAEIERRASEWGSSAVDPGRHTDRTLDREMIQRARAAFRAGAARPPRPAADEMRLELIPVPVTDVDRAKTFYVDRVGFHPDFDVQVNPELRFVQLTPPGSAASICFGTGIVEMAPGTQRGLQMVIADAGETRRQLLAHGVEASDVDVQPWGSFVYFSDPDGNRWSLQQLPVRDGGEAAAAG